MEGAFFEFFNIVTWMNKSDPQWEHPGGKLIEVGSAALTQEELVAILIGTGYKGKTALEIANDLMYEFYSFYGLLGKKPEDLARIKGVKKGKIRRIAAAYEIAKRIIRERQWEFRAVRKITLELSDLSDSELLAVLIEQDIKKKPHWIWLMNFLKDILPGAAWGDKDFPILPRSKVWEMLK
jgi:DNA repair protein RadC